MSLSSDPRFRRMNINIDFVAKLMELEQLIKNTMDTYEEDFCCWHENSDLLMHFYPILAPLALDLNLITCRYRQNRTEYEQILDLELDQDIFLDDDLPSFYEDGHESDSEIDHDSSYEHTHA